MTDLSDETLARLPPLEVVVVAYGPVELLRFALRALEGVFRVIIVDNGRDDDVEREAEARGAIYLRPDHNLGFGSAVNVALQHVTVGADVLLLNPDARLPALAVHRLQASLHTQPRTAAVAPVLQRPDGMKAEPTRWPMPTPLLPWRGVIGRGGLGPQDRFFLSGAVLMLSGRALQEVGGFDERFFLYAEESDWQKRALEQGFVVREVTDVIAEHLGAATSSDSVLRDRYFHGSAELFIRKWYGYSGWWTFRLGSLAAAVRRSVTTTSPSARGSAVRTIGSYVRGPASLLPARPGTSRLQTVVHVVRSDSFAGVERYICDVSSELARRGWNVTVVGGDVDHMRALLPVSVQCLPATTTVRVMRQLIGRGRVGLVHAHMTAGEFAAVGTRPWTRAAVVSTRHFASPRGASPHVRRFAHLVARGLEREVAISAYVAAHVEGPTTVLHSGVPDAPLARDPDSRTILVMQRLQAEKDTATAVRAFSISQLAQEGWRMIVAGRGPLAEDLSRLAMKLGVGRSVDFLGFIADPTAVRAGAAVFLASAPSEPFGLSVAEAMAQGLAVLAAAGGAHAEVLGGTGELFPPGDADECAAALRRLAWDRELRMRLGDKARARQRTHLSIAGHVDRLEQIYTEALL